MVLAELGRKITTALHSLSKATIINEEVCIHLFIFLLHDEHIVCFIIEIRCIQIILAYNIV